MTTGDPTAPAPLLPGEFAPALAAAARGADFRTVLEELLIALPDDRADRLMHLLRESRGSWFPLMSSRGGDLLFLGNALSGSITPLAAYGFRVTALDPSAERGAFARLRNEAHAPGRVTVITGGREERLPFDDRSFDVVVQEDGLPGRTGLFAHGIDEVMRVSRGEIVLTVDNRLGYKRSSERRNDFHIPSPVEFLRAAIAPRRGERTVGGYRRLLERHGFARPRAFSLYPHRQNFTFVVGLDEPRPKLGIGPKEKKNRVKLFANAVGLFPVFTPSFALIGARRELARERTRLDRILLEIARVTGEPLPAVEQLVGTRGNTAVIHTSIPGASESEPRGRWTLHVPLCPKNIPQLELHYRTLETLRKQFPTVPAPEPLVHGRIDDVWLSCERRVPGWTAPQISGDRAKLANMLGDASRHFAQLVVREAAPMTDLDYEVLVGTRIDLVARHAAVPSTIERLQRMRVEFRARLIGRNVARVLHHADLRGKHVQVAPDGRVLGYLDWGTTEPAGLPYFDLLHLVVHERKQEHRCSAGDAWRIVRDRRGLREYEERALSHYRRTVRLDDETARAIEELYPVLVAAMAEKNWDYSRPRWLHRQFGI